MLVGGCGLTYVTDALDYQHEMVFIEVTGGLDTEPTLVPDEKTVDEAQAACDLISERTGHAYEPKLRSAEKSRVGNRNQYLRIRYVFDCLISN